MSEMEPTEKERFPEEKKEKSQKEKKRTLAAISIFLLVLGNALFFFLLWLIDRYDNPTVDQLLFMVKSSAAGTNSGLVGGAILFIGGFVILFCAIEAGIYLLLSGRLVRAIKAKSYGRYSDGKTSAFLRKHHLPMASVLLLVSLLIFFLRLDIFAYVGASVTKSDFIEENYVSPNEVTLNFPEQKRNLIYIVLESMENTFSDTEAGGAIKENYMPELTTLAKENVTFSSTEGIGGALSYNGTTWTAAALAAHTSGVTVKVSLFQESFGEENSFLPGLVTIGDILEKEGYNQTVLFGSDARFACRDYYFSDHGNYNIVDTVSLKAEGKLPYDYEEWWGFEDEKLFEFAKEEILKLASMDEPFNFTMLTADTHFPDGYVCRLCENEYEKQYANVIRCSSKQVSAFVDWIKEQDFYENTTIVLAGDHLTMDSEFLADCDEDYTRTLYNCFINSAQEPSNDKNRQFGVFDMFPTTLAAMGVEIEGNRLALGTNLFSEEKTLTEKFGYEKFNYEMLKKSEYYNQNFFENDED